MRLRKPAEHLVPGLASDSLDDFLMEFDHVVQDFEKRVFSQYEPHLEELRKKALSSTYDSGIDDSESKSASPSSSLNTSEEDLSALAAPLDAPSSTAKLGDTHELEEFIADLDRILEEM
ncbi:regulator of cell cycle RGCC-like [Python bivittatus]|uniref:Regulator of cell cycle RGCC-like n=1 Tax=Python bivittatus TaxID=176946 RepID=A0A9F2WG77_PYTBI|nr:regulator of cell cycle RGCC-like [Python bivittatus]